MFWSLGVGRKKDLGSKVAVGWGSGDGKVGHTTIRAEVLKNPRAITVYYTLHEMLHAMGLPHSNPNPHAIPCKYYNILCYSHQNWVLWYNSRKPENYGLTPKEVTHIQSLDLEDVLMFPDTPDYEGAEVIPAMYFNRYGDKKNHPKAIVLHTPEEPADDWESTPRWFQNPLSRASTHYYLDNDSDVVQMVAEIEGAWAQGVTEARRMWKGEAGQLPPWAQDGNLNLHAISIEMEGYAATIHETMPRGGVQWKSLIKWLKYVTNKYDIPLDRDHIVGHYEVASHKRDPGPDFDWMGLMEDLRGESDYELLRNVDAAIVALSRARTILTDRLYG